MKRVLALISMCLLLSAPTFANHITGGEIFYKLVTDNGDGTYTYAVTLKLFRNCGNVGAQLDANAAIGVFDRLNGTTITTLSVALGLVEELQITDPGPCITNPPSVCYQVGYYEFSVTLPARTNGYLITYQRCCRIAGINNLNGSSTVGATYTAEIPGTNAIATAPANNSAHFTGRDTVIVCANNAFLYSFGAVDADPTDVLTYYFCDAYEGGGAGSPAPNPPLPPPYSSVSYASPYSGGSPLGNTININSNTGLITGIAPAAGIYVVTVCVTETRNGVVIATQRKDLQIKIGDCDIARAQLEPQYISCDGYTLDFSNLNSSPLINSFYWEFGDPASGANNSANIATPSHTFSDTGIYKIKLVTNRNQECSDSTEALVKVYPGFFPDFNFGGICVTKPVSFTDATTTAYGFVNSWSWSFGDETSIADVSAIQNPSWQYSSTGPKSVILTVGSSKGCVKTVTKVVDIIDKPLITLAFRDTLICINDAVQLQASGTGVFSWTPLTNIVNANSATPTVKPPVNTVYRVKLDDQGCINNDSVRVRVVNAVTLNVMGDTTICETDPVQLRASGDALKYAWTPTIGLSNPGIANPIASSGVSTPYRVVASIGSCTATKTVTVTAVPYPIANAGPDTTLCYNTPGILQGSHNGQSFSWSPLNYMTNTTSLTPTVVPPRTISYILSSIDNRGCPKPGRDTILVTVLPKILANAGRDTAVIVGQELQFNATGGVAYLWSPSVGLNAIDVADPIGVYDGSIDSIRYKVRVFNSAGCADSAFIVVKVFKTVPTVFVPTGFTPNNDGLNDQIRPIAVGIARINYFRIFNRWGQLVFSTTTNGAGWDGKIKGVPQATNTFVWEVSAVDYLGKGYFQKGTVTLIR